MSWCRSALLFLFFLLAGPVIAESAKLPVVERLEYEVSYQGPLTAGSKISIASVSLQTRKINLASFAGFLFETSMRVSSEIFSFVEESYPFRVHYRSLYQVNPFALMALEKYKLSDKLKHELTWVDRQSDMVGRYRQKVAGPGLPATISNWLNTDGQFNFYKPARHKIPDGLVDRLAMLQAVRLKQMEPGVEYRFPVTDGKRLLDYQVKVVALEQIQHAGKNRYAWKLVLNGLYTKKAVTEPRHAPIYLWLTKEQPRLPLRFVHYHPLGTFTVDFQGKDRVLVSVN